MPNQLAATREDDKGGPTARRLASLLAPGLIAAGAFLPGVAGAASNPVVGTATLSGVGTVLVSGHRALYMFLNDRPGHSACTGACTTAWPPLTVSASSAHHLGHLHGLGTIRRPDSRLQVTFHGHPLYFFANDHTVGTAAGQAFLDLWFTLRPNGVPVHLTSSGASGATPPSSPVPGSTNPTPSTTAPTDNPPVGSNQGSGAGNGGPSPQNVAPNEPPATAPPATNPPPTAPPPTSPPPTSPPPTSPPPTSPPPTSPPPPTTTVPSGGGVSF